MKYYIKKFRASGELWRLALVEDFKIIEIHCFDETGKEIETDLSKWFLNENGDLEIVKKSLGNPLENVTPFAQSTTRYWADNFVLQEQLAHLTQRELFMGIDPAREGVVNHREESENRHLRETIRMMDRQMRDLEDRLHRSQLRTGG
jgi:hypothetical protein